MQIKKILVPTDFSDCAKAALDQALLLAAEYKAEICLLHVIALQGEDPAHPDTHFPETEAIYQSFEKRAMEAMGALLAEIECLDLTISHDSIRGIAPGPAIVDYAADMKVDMVVLGTHGRRGARRFLMGSVTEEVLGSIGCPAVTVKGADEAAPRGCNRILVPYDFSEDSDLALETATELAVRHKGEIHLVHVVTPPVTPAAVSGIPVPGITSFQVISDFEGIMAARVKGIMGSRNPTISQHVLEGPTANVLVDFAAQHDVDLIVMGSHGLTGFWRFLLGSITQKVVRAASCPVWVMRSGSKTTDASEG